MNGKVPPDFHPAHEVDLASGSPRGMRLRWRKLYIVNTTGVWKERRIQTLLHQDGWRTFVLLSNWDNLAVHPGTFSQQTQYVESIYRISLRARTVIPARFTFILWSFLADAFNGETAVQHLDMTNRQSRRCALPDIHERCRTRATHSAAIPTCSEGL